jgi:hypothetical protein
VRSATPTRNADLPPPARAAAPCCGQKFPAERVERCRRKAVEQNLGKNFWTGYHRPLWTEAELSLPPPIRLQSKPNGQSVSADKTTGAGAVS